MIATTRTSLKQWMQCEDGGSSSSSSSSSSSDTSTSITINSSKESKLPFFNHRQEHDVLILDGGVSTHLEHMQQQKHQQQQSSSSSSSSFEHRLLWSSSLLLTPQGQNDIRSTHDTFFNAGCDIISTVTYQLSHYFCTDSEEHTQPDTDNTNTISSNDYTRMKQNLNLTYNDIDRLLHLGIQLAHESRLKRWHDELQHTNQQQLKQSRQSMQPLHPNKYIVVSLGCFGSALADGSEYRGNYGRSLHDLITFHQGRFNTVMDYHYLNYVASDDEDVQKHDINANKSSSQVDGIAFETVPCALEVEAIINVLQTRKKTNTNGAQNKSNDDDNVAIWISLACKNDSCLNDGTPINDVLQMIESLDNGGLIHGIGVNCFDVKNTKSLTTHLAQHQLRSNHNRAIIFYPNSGEEWDARNERWKEEKGCKDHNDFSEYVIDGINSIHSTMKSVNKQSRIIVGGCCRTSPTTIQSLRTKVDEMLLKEC